jgi:hypothetical protein
MFDSPFGAATVGSQTQWKKQKKIATWGPCEASPKCLVSVE